MSTWVMPSQGITSVVFFQKLAGHLRLQDHGGYASRWRHEQRIGALALKESFVCMFLFLDSKFMMQITSSDWPVKYKLSVHMSWRLMNGPTDVASSRRWRARDPEVWDWTHRHGHGYRLCPMKLGDACISSLNPTVSRVSMLQKWRKCCKWRHAVQWRSYFITMSM